MRWTRTEKSPSPVWTSLWARFIGVAMVCWVLGAPTVLRAQANTATVPMPQGKVQASAPSAPQLTDDWRRALKELREDPINFKRLVFAILERRLASDLAFNMRREGFSQTDITNTLESAEFRRYVAAVLTHKDVTKMVDGVLAGLLTPGLIEAEVERQEQRVVEMQREEQMQALREWMSYRQSRSQPKSDPGIWAWLKKAWDSLMGTS